jgi:hypothetical protein
VKHVCLLALRDVSEQIPGLLDKMESVRVALGPPTERALRETYLRVGFSKPWVSKDHVITLEVRGPESLWTNVLSDVVIVRTADSDIVGLLELKLVTAKAGRNRCLMEKRMLKSIKFYHSKADEVDFSPRVVKRSQRHRGAVRERDFYIHRDAELLPIGVLP